MAQHTAGDLLLGRYRLDVTLGRGGAGTVWRARDTRLGRPVAIKVLSKRRKSAAEAVAEARTVAALSNPHVVALYEFAEDDHDYYLVTEVVDGASLESVLASRSLSSEEAAALMAPVARALAAAHRAGVIHGDIKPANVLLGREGQVKLADFGSAAYLRTMGKRTDTVEVSPAYAAPEVLSGGAPTISSDLYALGATLARAVGASSSRAPLPKNVSGHVRSLLTVVLADDPRDRLGAADEVAEELELIGAGVERRSLVRQLASAHAAAEPLEAEAPLTELAPRWRADLVARLWPATLLGLASMWAVDSLAGAPWWGLVPGAVVGAAALFWLWPAGMAALLLSAAGALPAHPGFAAALVIAGAPLWLLAGRSHPRMVLAPLLAPFLGVFGVMAATPALLAKTLRPLEAVAASAAGATLFAALWGLTTLALRRWSFVAYFLPAVVPAWHPPATRTVAVAIEMVWLVGATAVLALTADRARWLGPTVMIALVVVGFAALDTFGGPLGAAPRAVVVDLSLSLIIGALVMAAAPEGAAQASEHR